MDKNLQGLLLGLLLIVSMTPAAALAARCTVGTPFAYTAPYDLQECPRDIQAWMDRANGCAALEKETMKPEERDDALFEMECNYLPCDYQEMASKYKGNGVLTSIIKAYKDIVFGEKNALVCDEKK